MSQSIEALRAKAEELFNITNDEWVKNFTQSLMEQLDKGRNLSEKQQAILDKNYNTTKYGPALSNDQKYKLTLVGKAILRVAPEDSWNQEFLKSVKAHLERGKDLSIKQQDVLKKILDKLCIFEETFTQNVNASAVSLNVNTASTSTSGTIGVRGSVHIVEAANVQPAPVAVPAPKKSAFSWADTVAGTTESSTNDSPQAPIPDDDCPDDYPF